MSSSKYRTIKTRFFLLISFVLFFNIEGNFGDIIGCLSNNNSTHVFQTYDTDPLCIDYCLKQSVSFAGKKRIVMRGEKLKKDNFSFRI